MHRKQKTRKFDSQIFSFWTVHVNTRALIVASDWVFQHRFVKKLKIPLKYYYYVGDKFEHGEVLDLALSCLVDLFSRSSNKQFMENWMTCFWGMGEP